MRILPVLLAAAWLGGGVRLGAQTDPALDQSFTQPPDDLGAALADGYAFVGQSATAGVTGDLVNVEVEAARNSDFNTPWVLDIQPIVAGVPTGVSVSSTVIQPRDFPTIDSESATYPPLSLQVKLAHPVFLTAGEGFVILLHPRQTTGSPGLTAGTWDGSTGAGYAGGTVYLGTDARHLNPQQGYDLYFRTFVSPVPEPSGMMLAVVSGIVVSLWFRLRLAASAAL